MLTPGDNDWTDCDRPANVRGEPPLEFQGHHLRDANVQGSCNNLCDVNPDPAEYAARNAADIAWLRETFAQAKAEHSSGVMLVSQANPGFDLADPARAPLRDPRTLVQPDTQPDGFHDFLAAVRNAAIDFRRPVVYVHGDSHYFRIDKGRAAVGELHATRDVRR